MKSLLKSLGILAAVAGLQTRPAKKILTLCALVCTLATLAHSQSRQTQAILDSWDREIITEIFADTVTSDIQYSDTVDIGRWAGSPEEFALFAQLDSIKGTTYRIDFAATFDLALESTGPFYVHADGTNSVTHGFLSLNGPGKYVFDTVPYGGNFLRFSFHCNDTLFLRAVLWMKH